jgi:hypothetical protein
MIAFHFHEPVSTPLGRGLVAGISPDHKQLQVVHRPDEIDVVKFGRKPKACIFLFHPIESVTPLRSA